MDTELLLSLNYKVSSHFRLLAADKSWFERIKQKEEISQTRKERSKSRKIALVMKNNGVLYALDDDEAGMVRRIEYSNSLLLAQHSTSPISQLSVVGTLNAMYEVQSSPAENNALFCLRSSYLTLDELNGKANPNFNLWNFSELVLLSQSTPKQLSDILISEGAVIHQGKVRLLDPLFLLSTLHEIIFFFQSNEIIGGSTAFWDLAKLQLSSIPSLAIDVVRSLFSSDKAVQSSTISLFDHRKTVVSIGKYVFLSNSESLKREVSSVQTMGLPSESFLEEWVKCIPSSFFNVESFPDRTDVKGLFALLSGCIVQTTRDSTSWVWWVPSDSLPRSIEARLSILFSIKDEMWDGVDLQAYIEPILAADQSFPHAIQRFTREYRIPGKPVAYSLLSSHKNNY